MFRISPDAVTPPASRTVSFEFEGARVDAFEGQTVAQALIAANRRACRTTPVSGSARAPYCLMGVCFDCLVTIDGRQNQQACLIAVREGMCVATQHGERLLDLDSGAADVDDADQEATR